MIPKEDKGFGHRGSIDRDKRYVVSDTAHERPLHRDPDGVIAAEEVFDTRCIDARGGISVGRLDA